MVKEMKFCAYTRVSTNEQGKSGLGLEAQLASIRRHVTAQAGKLIAPVFTDIASGRENDRPELAKAIVRAQATGATLIVSKLDRLSRNAAFILTTYEALKKAGIEFVTVDNPTMNTLMLGIYASFAQYEREQISERTKAALKAAKARGTKLGGRRKNGADICLYRGLGQAVIQEKADAFADRMRPIIEPLLGETLSAIAQELTSQGILTRTGKAHWTPTGVRNLLKRL